MDTEKRNRKRQIVRLGLPVMIIPIIALMLTSCGKVQSAKSLKRTAKMEHGKCTVVSKTETTNSTVVVLHDTLQDFDYEYRSAMQDISIDGTSFGSLPSTSDTFMENLEKKVIANVQSDLDTICDKPGMHYEGYEDDKDVLMILYCANEKDGEEAASACAEVLNTQNVNNRLDGLLIYVVGNQEMKWNDNDYYGSVKLPDTDFRTPTEESIDYYTEKAQELTDPQAKFLRMETGVFRDTGADLNRVVYVLGSDYPTEMNSPVTFYYFEASDGTEYYLCDFNYYDEDGYNFSWYTTYQGK